MLHYSVNSNVIIKLGKIIQTSEKIYMKGVSGMSDRRITNDNYFISEA